MKRPAEAKILEFKGLAQERTSSNAASHVECDRVSELLPWFLNGTLDAAETAEVQTHLTSCGSCRRELAATADIWRLATDHPDSMDLALYVADSDAMDPHLRGEVERHLKTCAECSTLVEGEPVEGERVEGERDANVVSFRRRKTTSREMPRVGGRWIALAASLVAVVLLGGYLSIFSAHSPDRDVVGATATQPSAMNPVQPSDSRAPDDSAALVASEGWESGLIQATLEPGTSSSAMISAFDFESGIVGSPSAAPRASEL